MMFYPKLEAIALFLDQYLEVTRFPADQHGIYRSGKDPIRRIGLAIEPWAGIGQWASEQELDALFLHRPWKIKLATFPSEIGILAYHLSFDLMLTFGFNPPLATQLGMHNPIPFAFRDTIPYGMFGDIPTVSLHSFVSTLTNTFAIPPETHQLHAEKIQRIAIVGAMNDQLIREAAAQGVQLYITGQFRQPARKAVQETGMAVAVIGHATGEQWGIRALGTLLQERWPDLGCIITQPNQTHFSRFTSN
ncbi:hypothetical protein KDA_59160 [Dictyobacter alpinus]|uniref:GTP cyclohydrolase 1 type 2 homolog n=1 Tax=Dictyobacter alpinus TaxID=2014873 RepID=A0A402BGS5_9CHLR|nr:Nif3-like dinuclear metal center hexameric protein [Dictyobacter alpinus]GCE30432.1 hypothetical protein KDA_59160 [Dictyobacter alpinus]